MIAVGLAVSGFAMWGGVAGASAGQPVPVFETVSGTAFVADCGTFEIWDEFELTSSGHLYLDKNGDPMRIVQHVWGSDRLYNPENGNSFSGTINAGEIVDLVGGQATESGQVFRIVVPGAGALFLDVGRFTIDFEDGLVFLKGRHQYFEGDFAALCAALI
jgi:hypothetical protein